MKTFAVFVFYLLVKNGLAVWRGIVGGFDLWLIVAYVLVGVIIFKSPLKREIKSMYAVLAALDGLLPLAGSLWLRWLGVILSGAWLASYIWRATRNAPSVQSPWKPARTDANLAKSRPNRGTRGD